MSQPAQKRYWSKQDYETPWPFIRALERKFGESFTIDLAAREDNKKAPACITEQMNSLTYDWSEFTGLLWLNPPFADIGPWAEKCAKESSLGARVVMLTPASVSTNWFAKHCHKACRVVFLRPRITFVGATTPYPKDLMLTLWGMGQADYEIWNWVQP